MQFLEEHVFVNNNRANRKKPDCQNLPDRFRWCIINIIEQQFSMQHQHRHRTTVFFLCENENVLRSHFQMTDVATRSCQHHRSASDRYKNRINDPIPWINFRPNLAFHLIEYDELNRLSSKDQEWWLEKDYVLWLKTFFLIFIDLRIISD